MKRVRTLLVRALVGSLVLLSLCASVASADTGWSGQAGIGSAQFLLPEDPGLE